MKLMRRILFGVTALSRLVIGLGQAQPATIQFSASAENVAEDAGAALLTVVRTGQTQLTIVDNEEPVVFDASFDAGPGAMGAFGYSCVMDLVLQPDVKILIGGCFTNVGGLARAGIARLNPNGSVDPSFDPGRGISEVSSGYSSTISALALQADGRIVIGGSFFRVAGRIEP